MVLYSTANDPQNGPQMILDRKWSPTWTSNDPVKNWGRVDLIWLLDQEWGCFQRNLRGKKGTFSFRLLKKNGRRTPDHRLIYTRRLKNGINLKRIWYQQYFFLWQLLQISFRRCKNLRLAGLYAEIHCKSIILTSRSSTCLLRSKNLGTSTEQVLSMIFSLEVSN